MARLEPGGHTNGGEVSYLTSLRLCVFSNVLEMNLVTYAMVRGPIAGSSFSHPSKQLMEDVKHSSSMVNGRRPLAGGAGVSGGTAVDAMAACQAGVSPVELV